MGTQQRIITCQKNYYVPIRARRHLTARNIFPLSALISTGYSSENYVGTLFSNVLHIKKSNKNIIYIPVIHIFIKRLELLRAYVVFKLRTCGNTRFYYVMKNSPCKARNA